MSITLGIEQPKCPRCNSTNINKTYCNECYWHFEKNKTGGYNRKGKPRAVKANKACKVCGSTNLWNTSAYCYEHILEYNRSKRQEKKQACA